MECKQQSAWGWAKRPQVWALLFACLVAFVGVWRAAPSAWQSGAPTKQAGAPGKERLPFASTPPAATMPEADCRTVPCLALTFDDGPDKNFTPVILDTLARYNVRATFFVTGIHAEQHPDLIKREYQTGHEVGNHSWDHTDFTKLNPAQIRDQISRTQQAIATADVPTPTLFRPPYGAANDVVLANVPLTIVRWNIDPEDWKVKHPSNIIEHTMATVKPGAVIILHDTEQYTAEALGSLLQQLEGHYQFVTVSELFNLPPGQRGVYFGR